MVDGKSHSNFLNLNYSDKNVFKDNFYSMGKLQIYIFNPHYLKTELR